MSIGGMFLAHELGSDAQFPSFFEVFMQDRIHQSLKPAVRHVVLVLAERWPRVSLSLLDHFDEVFALLSLFLERHYLARNDALLAESLYGFKRSRYNKQTGEMTPLTPLDRRKALLLNILAPYAKAKLDALYTQWRETLPPTPTPTTHTHTHTPTQEPTPLRLRRAFVAMYPLLHASYEGSFFLYQWAYLLGHSKHYSPLLHLLQVVLRRQTREDIEQAHTHTLATKTTLGARLMKSMKIVLVLAIISFKLLEWWVSTPELTSSLAAAHKHKRIVPPPPDPPTQALTSSAAGGSVCVSVPLPKDTSLCPLCKQVRVNPAVSSAGVAFCYRCLLAHVREFGLCPVTLQGCREEQVRRVYLT